MVSFKRGSSVFLTSTARETATANPGAGNEFYFRFPSAFYFSLSSSRGIDIRVEIIQNLSYPRVLLCIVVIFFERSGLMKTVLKRALFVALLVFVVYGGVDAFGQIRQGGLWTLKAFHLLATGAGVILVFSWIWTHWDLTGQECSAPSSTTVIYEKQSDLVHSGSMGWRKRRPSDGLF
jgi:hypothetical protein